MLIYLNLHKAHPESPLFFCKPKFLLSIASAKTSIMNSYFTMSFLACLSVTLLSGCTKDNSSSLSLTQSSDVIVDNRNVYKTSGKTIEPLDVIWEGYCTGESVHVTGQIVLTYNIIQKSAGTNYAVEFHYQNTKGIGMTSGKPYNIVGYNASHLSQNFSLDNFTKTSTISGKIMWITPGENNNVVAIASYKVIQSGQGDLIIDKNSYVLTCE